MPRNDPFEVELSNRSKQTLRGSVRFLQRPPNNWVLRSHKIVADEKDSLLLDQIRRPVPGMPSGLKGSDRPFTKSHTLGWPDFEINSRLAQNVSPHFADSNFRSCPAEPDRIRAAVAGAPTVLAEVQRPIHVQWSISPCVMRRCVLNPSTISARVSTSIGFQKPSPASAFWPFLTTMQLHCQVVPGISETFGVRRETFPLRSAGRSRGRVVNANLQRRLSPTSELEMLIRPTAVSWKCRGWPSIDLC